MVVDCRGAKATRRSATNTFQQSTLNIGSEGLQGAVPLPLDSFLAKPPPREISWGSHEEMLERVEADVNLLMAEQVPSILTGLTIPSVNAAYPRFQKELLGLPSKGLFECTFGESVWVRYFCSVAFTHVMFVAYQVTVLTLLVLLFPSAY